MGLIVHVLRETKRHMVKGVGTKAPFNGGFAFAWLSTKLVCTRLQRHDLFMNRPAIKFLILGRAS